MDPRERSLASPGLHDLRRRAARDQRAMPDPAFGLTSSGGAPHQQRLRILRVDLDDDVAALGDALEGRVVQRLRGVHLVVRAAVGVHGQIELDLVTPPSWVPTSRIESTVADIWTPVLFRRMILSRSPPIAPGLIACWAVPFSLSRKPTAITPPQDHDDVRVVGVDLDGDVVTLANGFEG